MIDLKDYADKKAKGLVTITKTDSNPDNPDAITYAVGTRKWDATTGERLPDEVVGVSRKELLDKKLELQTEIDQIDAFLTEAEQA